MTKSCQFISPTRTGEHNQVGYLGAFRALMNKMASENNLDYIIVDCGPDSGVLNMIVCMSCHYILPSAEPDFQNVCSLDGMLKYVLPR